MHFFNALLCFADVLFKDFIFHAVEGDLTYRDSPIIPANNFGSPSRHPYGDVYSDLGSDGEGGSPQGSPCSVVTAWSAAP